MELGNEVSALTMNHNITMTYNRILYASAPMVVFVVFSEFLTVQTRNAKVRLKWKER